MEIFRHLSGIISRKNGCFSSLLDVTHGIDMVGVAFRANVTS